jgi:leucyl aminopeptidase
MDVKLTAASASFAVKTDALIVLTQEGVRRPDLEKPLASVLDSGEIRGKFLDFTLLHNVSGFAAKRLLVAGAGKPEKLTPGGMAKLAGAAMRFLRGKGVKDVALLLEDALASAEFVEAAARASVTSVWEPDRLRTAREDLDKHVESVTILAATGDAGLSAACRRGVVIGEASNVARDIAVEPPNRLYPTALAERAQAVATASGLAIDILDRDRMQQLGMGTLLGVAQGSAQPPVMIVMSYKPEKAAEKGGSDAHLALIGKGVTFDTGGISIKPADGMEKMKYDMAGGAAVIGAMQAIAKLKPGVAVTGIIPAVENMPGGRAQRPGDIVTSLSGKTVEVLNTDAEGRLILCDAITYSKQLGCTHLVDAATLTGAIAVALGHVRAGVFSNDEGLAAKWMAAAESSGELMWRMPLDDEYREQLKSVYADIQNIGARWGGACTAAMFLKEFAGDTPWVHVDVAGTAWLDDAKAWLAKGPTAIPLGTFVNFVAGWK